MNKKKSKNNKRALILLIILITFFTIGSVCGISSCVSQCSKSSVVHADDFSGSNDSKVEMPFVLNGSFDCSTSSFIYSDASFVLPFVIRIGEARAVGADYVLFQIGAFSNSNSFSLLTFQTRAQLEAVVNSGSVKLHWFDVRYYSNTNQIMCSGSTILSVGTRYNSTSGYLENGAGSRNFFTSAAFTFSSGVLPDNFDFGIGQQFVGYKVFLSKDSTTTNDNLKFSFYFGSVEINLDFSFNFVPTVPIEEYIFVSNSLPYTLSYSVPEVDLSSLIKDNFQDGKEFGYAQGYEEGYQIGKVDGYSEGVVNTDYTFASLFNSVTYAPLKTFVSMFNFDLLGVNMLDFVTSVLTVLAMFGFARLFI